MRDTTRTNTNSSTFDYSTPEAQDALSHISELVLEIRDEVSARVDLYERTLGLAVIPVLMKRTAVRWIHNTRERFRAAR